jgi:hypothetical protein
LKDDLQEGRSTSIEARAGFKESPACFAPSTSKVWLFPGNIEGLFGSKASGAASATLLRIVGIVFFTN